MSPVRSLARPAAAGRVRRTSARLLRNGMSEQDKICFVSCDVEHDNGSNHAKTFEGVGRMNEVLNIFNR